MQSNLDGRNVILTGVGGRLGRVVLEKLMQAGATVTGLDAQEVSDAPEGLRALQVDLTSESGISEAFQRVVDARGDLHGVIHTVGMWGGAPLTETGVSDWDRMLDINLKSTFLVFREAASHMQDAGGRLVAIASKQGVDAGVAEQGPYSAAKAGVVRLVESSAAEYDGRITAAAVAPSMILFGDEEGGTEGVTVDAIADLCVYLCGAGGVVHNGEVIRAFGTMR